MEKEPSIYKQFWDKLPSSYKKYLAVLLILLAVSAFFSVFYFSDGLSELINMSRKIGEAGK